MLINVSYKDKLFSKVRDYRVRKLLTEKELYVFEMKEKDNELKN